jgi:hypothetical protein
MTQTWLSTGKRLKSPLWCCPQGNTFFAAADRCGIGNVRAPALSRCGLGIRYWTSRTGWEPAIAQDQTLPKPVLASPGRMPTHRQWRSNSGWFLFVVNRLGRLAARKFATARSAQQGVECSFEQSSKVEARTIGQPDRLVSQDELLVGRFADRNVQSVLSFGALNRPAF